MLVKFKQFISEEWSNKYKKSIDCSNPKGFSQKAHCQGRKLRRAGVSTKSKPVNEENKKPRTAKAAIIETDFYGAKGYHAQCKEHGCEWKSRPYDRIQQAQAAAKRHHVKEHFK